MTTLTEEKRYIPRPEARYPIPAFVYTSAGWIEGAFRVPPIHAFGDWLDHGGHFFKLVDVTLPGAGHPIPFFALHRDAVVFAAPKSALERPERSRYLMQNTRSHRVTVLLTCGILEGTIDVLADVRVSDFLSSWPRFVPIHDAAIAFRDELVVAPMEQPIPLVFVNGPRVIGFAEIER